jgi:hypothetical protein
MSEVWNFFEKMGSERAKCKECNSPISCKGSSTGGMIKHLKGKHNIEIRPKTNTNTPQPSKKRKSVENNASSSSSSAPTSADTGMFKFVKRQSMNEILARLVALDGFSVNAIAKSEFIRESVTSRGYELPKSNHNIMAHVLCFYEEAKRNTINRIKEIKAEDRKFSITLDEWTSLRNRRFLNVNLHSDQNPINLGLIRIKNTCPSEEIERLTNEKLNEFNLTMSDIVGATTDGAAVMVKFGRNISAVHQQCYNHAMHLGIVDVIFKKIGSTAGDENENNDDCYDESESDYESNDSDDEEAECDTFDRADIHKMLLNVRKIVRLFKNSPVRNSILQKHVVEEFGKELSLLLDCKTRWNSTETMIERFLRIYESIKAALIDLNLNHQILNETELEMLKELMATLRPVRMAVEKLSSRDANLITSEGILQFVLEELKSNNFNGNINKEVYNALTQRISQRRNEEIVSAMKYLRNRSLATISELPVNTKKNVMKTLGELAEKYFPREDIEADQNDERDGDNEIGKKTLSFICKVYISNLIIVCVY